MWPESGLFLKCYFTANHAQRIPPGTKIIGHCSLQEYVWTPTCRSVLISFSVALEMLLTPFNTLVESDKVEWLNFPTSKQCKDHRAKNVHA